MTKRILYISLLNLLFLASLPASAQEAYFTNGFRISELTANEAIIWTRLCGQEKPNPVVHERKPKVFRHPLNFNEDMPVDEMDGAVRGAEGYVRAIVEGAQSTETSDWFPAEAKEDYTVHIPLEGLIPDTKYTIRMKVK